jgi:CelD/BcsL family acetyltransferase involved in cellulose biosynthesis
MLGRVVEILRMPTADGIEPIVTPHKRREILTAFLAFLQEDLKPDLLLAHSLTREFHTVLNEHFSGHNIQQGERQKGYYLDLPDSTDDFWALYKSNFRSQLRKKIKTGENAGLVFRTVEATQLPPGYDMQQAIENHTRLHKMRFESMNRPSFFLQPDFQVFHTHLCNHPDGDSCVLSFTEALHEGKVIGSLYGVRTPYTYIYLMVGFDPAYSSFSLGNLMIYYTIEDLIRRGVKKFDFKCGEESYKERWSKDFYEKFNAYIIFNSKGRFLYFNQSVIKILKKLQRAPGKIKKILRSRAALI